MHARLIALCILVSASGAHAQEHRYDFAQVSRLRGSDLNGHGDSATRGVEVAGSVAVNNRVHVFGSASRGTTELRFAPLPLGPELKTELDLSQHRLGVGVHRDMNDRTDLLGELEGIRTRIEGVQDIEGIPVRTDFDDAVRASIGVRHWMGQRVGVWAKAHVTHSDTFDNTVGATFGGELLLTRHVGVVLDAEVGDGASRYGIGVRASF